MVSKSSSSDVSAPNFNREPISDEDVIRGFILALGAGGRKQKTLTAACRSATDRPKQLKDIFASVRPSPIGCGSALPIKIWH